MAKVHYLDPIDYISGKISRKFITCYNHKPINGLNFTSVPGRRTTPLTLNEVAARQRFKTVQAAVRARQGDPSKITQDQLDFIAQKNTADGRKTMKAYLWSICGAEYDQNH